MQSRRWLAIAGAVVLAVGGIAVWRVWQSRVDETQTEVVTPSITTVTALGRLEPEGEVINLIAPTATQENRIEQLLVEEGDSVEAGEVIAVLDNRDRLQAVLQQAEEQVQIARTQLAQVQAGAKSGEIAAQQAEIARLQATQASDIAAQQAAVARLEAEVENARVEYQRYETLYQQGAVSASERDARELTLSTAQRQLQEAQAQLERIQTAGREQIEQARATLDQIAEVRPVDVAAAEAEVEAAIAAVAEAEANLAQTSVKAPIAGQVLKIHARPGERVADQGIATLGQTEQMKVIAEVYQGDIDQIEVGQSAEITSTVFSETLQGRVERIGLQVEPQQVVDENPAANIDAKVIEVHIVLNAEASAQVSDLTNLQVTATIQTQ
ncbi:HlyD family efflux transporter periplasmic adaptor subunit [Oscillatoria sp. CS-180]|uniref:HlyD family efflux transporter periplasmic adaptor subunit n=1 Tax=Oscillatoria sp. CS-180 TaxID=3021720 RepID=UPI00232E25E5|nr:HlyD family efflux transporter periplasmic adaptor subunit [Oscillatoria sp. CS-180]MDB9529884.1 HlyD family efflux transporter periplasmic adaptor subunit [Oscillatoria sp. CS-180]